MPTLHTEPIAITIDAPFAAVVADLADVSTHPTWATSFFAGPARPSGVDGEVLVDVPMLGGEARLRAAGRSDAGVIDLLLAPPGAPFGAPVPIRVVANGDGADVVFVLARQPGMPDAAWDHARMTMRAELGQLKERLEAGGC